MAARGMSDLPWDPSALDLLDLHHCYPQYTEADFGPRGVPADPIRPGRQCVILEQQAMPKAGLKEGWLRTRSRGGDLPISRVVEFDGASLRAGAVETGAASRPLQPMARHPRNRTPLPLTSTQRLAVHHAPRTTCHAPRAMHGRRQTAS